MASAGLYHLLYEPLICGQGNHVSRFCFCLSLVFVTGVVIRGELELCLFRVEKTSFHGETLVAVVDRRMDSHGRERRLYNQNPYFDEIHAANNVYLGNVSVYILD